MLSRLDRAESMLQALSEPVKEDLGSEAWGHESLGGSRKEATVEAATSVLGPLKAKLRARGRSSAPNLLQYEASCSRCGFKIPRPSRFCMRCGADFGKVVCSCGRELTSADKFCDHCGRLAEE